MNDIGDQMLKKGGLGRESKEKGKKTKQRAQREAQQEMWPKVINK